MTNNEILQEIEALTQDIRELRAKRDSDENLSDRAFDSLQRRILNARREKSRLLNLLFPD